MRIHDVWRGLPELERAAIGDELAALRDAGRWPPGAVVQLAQAISFRPQKIAGMPRDRLAELLARALGRLPAQPLGIMLARLHQAGRGELLGRVYDAFGVEHDGPLVSDDVLAVPLDESLAAAGLARLLDAADVKPHHVLLCLRVMACNTSPAWQPALERLRDDVTARLAHADAHGGRDGASLVGEPPTTELLAAPETISNAYERKPTAEPGDIGRAGATERDDEGTGDAHLPPEPALRREPSPMPRVGVLGDGRGGLTVLDRVLIDLAVASATGEQGAVGPDELEELVDEVVSLNAKRRTSWFHRGFVAALHAEPLAEASPGENDERRAWHMVGWLQGRMRLDRSPGRVRELLVDELGEGDRRILLSRAGRDAGAELAPAILLPLLRASEEDGRVDEALTWLEAYLPTVARKVLRDVLLWAKEGLIHRDPVPVRLVLEAVDRMRPQMEALHGPLPLELAHDLRRRLAVCWRRAGVFTAARNAVEELLAGDDLTEYERHRLLGDRALIAMGVDAIENLALPRAGTRQAFLDSIREQRDVLEKAVSGSERVPSALVALALPAVADPDADRPALDRAIQLLNEALSAMSNESAGFWNRTGLPRRCRFYLALLVLRSMDASKAVPEVGVLLEMLETSEGLLDDLPEDLVSEAIRLAVFIEVPGSARLATRALQLRPHAMLRGGLDLTDVARLDDDTRRAALDAIAVASSELPVGDRWRAWREILKGSIEGGSQARHAGERALDALQELATCHGRERQFLDLLDDEDDWSSFWSPLEADEARIQLLRSQGRMEDALIALSVMAHRAISAREPAEDLIEELDTYGASAEVLGPLKARLRSESAGVDAALLAVESGEPVAREPVRVLFVGGNETQAQYEQQLRGWYRDQHGPDDDLDLCFSGWSSNWGRSVDELKGRMGKAQAVVLMRYMRTNLGRTLRKASSDLDVPWVPCNGSGLASLQRAITRAVEVARARASEAARPSNGAAGAAD